jgi:hypothetical protein
VALWSKAKPAAPIYVVPQMPEPKPSAMSRLRSRLFRARRGLAPLVGIALVWGCTLVERLAARHGQSPWSVAMLVLIAAVVLVGQARMRRRHPGEAALFGGFAAVWALWVAADA